LPTVTDAHAVLGHFGGRGLLNGGFPLQIRRTHGELEKQKGRFATVERFAQGILGVSNAVIERAIRLISIERGHDTRDCTLVAFGGAGGLQACDLAESLEMRGVLLPVFPGALSALGILRADVVQDFSRTVLFAVSDAADARNKTRIELRRLRREAKNFLEREGFAHTRQRFEYRMDVSYVGQAYHLSVPESGNFVANFHRAHERAYGHCDPERPIEIVNVRCRATGLSARVALPKLPGGREPRSPNATQKVNCFLNGKPVQASLYEREKLRSGERFTGPAIIVEYSATSLVPTGWRARVDGYGQIHLLNGRRNPGRHVR
jgi:N-methylhydantoinase A